MFYICSKISRDVDAFGSFEEIGHIVELVDSTLLLHKIFGIRVLRLGIARSVSVGHSEEKFL